MPPDGGVVKMAGSPGKWVLGLPRLWWEGDGRGEKSIWPLGQSFPRGPPFDSLICSMISRWFSNCWRVHSRSSQTNCNLSIEMPLSATIGWTPWKSRFVSSYLYVQTPFSLAWPASSDPRVAPSRFGCTTTGRRGQFAFAEQAV